MVALGGVAEDGRLAVAEVIDVNEDEFRELNQVYRDERSDRAEAIEGWPAALAAARKHGPIGLITNFNDGPMQREKIRGAGLEGQFDGVYISGEVGVWKPEPGIFEHAASDLGRGSQRLRAYRQQHPIGRRGRAGGRDVRSAR